MKKRIIALLMALAFILSFSVVFTACQDESTDAGNTDDSGNTDNPGNNQTPPTDNTPSLDIDENIPGTSGKPSIDVVTDSSNSDAQAGAEDNYLHE